MTGVQLARFEVANPEAMHQFGIRLASTLRAGDLLVLVGPLGAGKTTLSRGIGEGLNAIANVSSPTFVIARTHQRSEPLLDETSQTTQTPDRQLPPLVHVDAYRLSSVDEFDDLDIDYANSITLVEWGRGYAEAVVPSWLDIEIDRSDADDVRLVTLIGHGARWTPEALAGVVA